MGRICAVAVVLTSILATGRAEGPSAPVAADFKIQVDSFALKPEPLAREELVARRGRVYQFATGTTEVVVVDPARGRVEILDIKRKVQTEIDFARLDEGLARVRARLDQTIRDREATGARAGAVEAAMTRDMLDPRFRRSGEPGARRVRLTNPTIEIDADGEPDPDPLRLALVARAMESIAKLGAFRVPDDLPPFAELEAIAALSADRRLRPTSISYLYRLAGPPRRLRRTYRLVPALTDREREAIARVDRLRESAKVVRYEQYRNK